MLQSRRLHGSLEDSWGDPEIDLESDGGASVQSGSEFGSEPESEHDGAYAAHVETPSSRRITRASSKEQPYGTPTKTATKNSGTLNRQTSKSSARSHFPSSPSTPGSNSLEPSFIMPSIYKTTEGFQTGSPLRDSHITFRQSRTSGERVSSPPRMTNRRVSSHREQERSQFETNELSDHDGVSQNLRSASKLRAHRPLRNDPPQGPAFYDGVTIRQFILPLLDYLSGVLGYAASVLQPLFGVSLALFAIWFITTALTTHLATAITTALSPLCILPGSTYVLPFCETRRMARADAKTPLFDGITQIESSFADMVSLSKDAYSLPFTMKSAEAAIRDINTLVKHSGLRSKAELENEINYFIQTAKQASSDLVKYNSKVGFVVDRIIVTNQWTEHVLQGIEEKTANTGVLYHVADALNPFSAFIAPKPTLHQQVFDQYLKHIGQNKEQITILINMAHALLALLTNMDERLDIIAEIGVRDNMDITRNREELLSRLWTKLGGNANTKRNYDSQLSVLSQVSRYKKMAVEHVHGSLLKLQEIASGLENLRQDVAAPETLGWRDDVPLQYHIETVKKGLERLREVQGDYREVQSGHYRKAMDPEGQKANMIDGAPAITVKVPVGRR